MGKIKKNIWILVSALLILVLSCVPVSVYADAASDIQVEQVVTRMPELKAYLTGTGIKELDEQQINAYIGDQKLHVDGMQDFSKSGEGIRYYFLLDISLSITETDFQALKNSVYSFVKKLGKKDQAVVITFGDEVNTFWSRDQGVKTLKKKLSQLSNDNMNTQLYEALIQASDMCVQNGDMMRNVAIVLTDGLDDIKGKSTKDEAIQKLSQNSLPVYGIAIGDGDTDGVDRFGELVRTSHGTLTLTDQDTATESLQKLGKKIKSAKVLSLSASSNQVNKGIQEVKFEFEQFNLVRSIDAGFYKWIADDTIPEIEDVQQLEKNQIEVTFSEPVTGMNTADNFELKSTDGKTMVPEGASVADEKTVRLTFQDDFYEGSYTLSCSNISDVSMEKNKVSGNFKITLEGERPSVVKEFLRNWGWLCAIGAVLVVLIIILIIYCVIRRRKGVVVVDDKMVLASSVKKQKRQMVEFQEKEGVHLNLYVSTSRSGSARLEQDLTDSLIVGRSEEICEVCIKDNKMSKQHFALEYSNGNVYIQDLESTNGTMLNGIRIHEKQMLRSNDKISAGNTTICVRW